MKPAEAVLPSVESSSRREFLHQAAGLGVAVLGREAAAADKAAPAPNLLPTVKLGSHQITRLIIGGNPIYGYSHFNKLLSQHMSTWHTPERVAALLKRAEEAGINTWQNSYAERTLQDLDKHREAGGKLNWLCLGNPDWDQHLERID